MSQRNWVPDTYQHMYPWVSLKALSELCQSAIKLEESGKWCEMKLDYTYDNEDNNLILYIVGYRPETDLEYQTRLNFDKKIKERQEKREQESKKEQEEKELYEKLKKKYGDK